MLAVPSGALVNYSASTKRLTAASVLSSTVALTSLKQRGSASATCFTAFHKQQYSLTSGISKMDVGLHAKCLIFSSASNRLQNVSANLSPISEISQKSVWWVIAVFVPSDGLNEASSSFSQLFADAERSICAAISLIPEFLGWF
jgi:hypothetical protein